MSDANPGLFRRLLSALRPQASAPQTTKSLTPMDAELVRFLGGQSSASGKVVNEGTAMTLSAAWGCTRVLTEAIGTVPYGIFEEKEGGDAVRVKDHELEQVLVYTPNNEMTGVEYKETKALNLVQAGNSCSFIDRLAGGVTALVPIEPRKVKVMQKYGSNTTLPGLREGQVFFRVDDRGRPEDFPRERIWHVKGFGNGIEGLSPLGAARESMGFSLAMQEFGARFFSQGGMPAGIVTIPGQLNPLQREAARENLNRVLGGLGGAHKFALFEQGMKPEAWGNTPLKDLEFMMLMQFSVPEICRFFRVPPHMVADLSRATFSNIEHLSQEFVMFTLMPYFTRIESSVTRWLMRPRERGKLFLRFNFEGLLRADSKGRAEFYQSALQNGWMNRNEVRSKEKLNRVEGLDTYTVQMNMTPVEKLGDLADANIKKSATPPAPPERVKPQAPTNYIINAVPEREVHVHSKGGDIHNSVHNAVRSDPAAPAPVHVDVAAPVVTLENGKVTEALAMLGKVIDGLRATQDSNRALAEKLLTEKE